LRNSGNWLARRYDLSNPDGWLAWVLTEHETPVLANPDQPCIRNAIDAAAPDHLESLALLADARSNIAIDLDLEVVHDILVRSPGTDPGGPDVSHLHSGGVAVLPGTSLAGVMRAQALRIARLVRDGKNDSERWVDRLFGPRFEGQRPRQGFKPHASRLRVREATIAGSQSQRQTRVAIDRFTQGAVDTALFNEQTEMGGRATVRVELRNPEPGELGLILLVVKDLLDGRVPVGGTSSVGRGVLCGSATIEIHDGNGAVPRSARVQPGKPPAGDAASEVDEAIRAFHREEPLSEAKSGTSGVASAGGRA
jgi:CRISPR/Cas system CSM-associated protein Csm3 (group 7 of RAMP superfamily)